ncbi:MAG TPA: MlaE family lipid ABC transporter permease subunit [Myxococcota bacterium]|nr:MlaE family lipid ABC transporter permease subunit [Myxococcota bacterium]
MLPGTARRCSAPGLTLVGRLGSLRRGEEVLTANLSAASLPADATGWNVERADRKGDRADLELSGRLSVRCAHAAVRRMRALLDDSPARVRVGLERLEALDAASAAVLLELCDDLRHAGAAVELGGASGRVRAILELVEARPRGGPPRGRSAPPGIVSQIGEATARGVAFARQVLDFTGQTLAAAVAAVREPRTVPWPVVTQVMERTGADALPIVSLISFLVGMVSAFQGAITLHKYGADIFVADGIAIGVTRELGPLMVAIVASGRSGAAFAAELGTMRVSEEVDALRTMGLDPFRYLVLPRVLALTAMVPLLTLLGDLVAVLGGAFVGVVGLDLTFSAYMQETRRALTLAHVLTGLSKSVAFGSAIGMIACQWGLATRGGAEGVGRSTTSAVVSTLFFLVVIDSAFTVLFNAWDV